MWLKPLWRAEPILCDLFASSSGLHLSLATHVFHVDELLFAHLQVKKVMECFVERLEGTSVDNMGLSAPVVEQLLLTGEVHHLQDHVGPPDTGNQRSTLRGTLGGFCPASGPPTPQKLWSIFSAFFAALKLAVIDTVMEHANVHTDCHLISCYASLYVSIVKPLQDCVEFMATL